MKNGIRVKLFLLLHLLLLVVYSFSQESDTTVVKKKKWPFLGPSTLNDTWSISGEPERHYAIDSSIFHIENFNAVQRDGPEYMNLGNTGTAAFPQVFSMDRTTGFNPGYNQFDLYRYKLDSIKHYQVLRPYAELSMVIGLHHEQMFSGKFANQYKKLVYYGVDFTRYSSLGIYQNQKAIQNAVSAYCLFNSKDNRWNIEGDVIFNSSVVQENGGVQTDPFDSSFFQKSLVPVNTITASNNFWQLNIFVKTSYNVGPSYYQRKNDTTMNKGILPVFIVSHKFNIDRNAYTFLDPTPSTDPAYYGKFYQPDTVYTYLRYIKVGNAAMLEYRPRTLTSDSTYSEKDFIATGEAGFDYYLLTQDRVNDNFGNLYIAGTFRNNFASKLKLLYKGSATYYLSGYNQHDLLVDGMAGYDFRAIGQLTGNASYQLKEAPYIFEHFAYSPEVNWNYTLPKTKTLNIGGKYQNAKYGITADLNYYVADHIPVYPGQANPYVTNSEENVFVAHAANRNSVAGFHFDDDVWFQYATRGGYIQLEYPMLYTKTSIYYETRVIKKLLWLAVGFDVRYRFQNNAPYYDPLLGEFYPSFTNLKSFPVVDAFFNAKIKTVRIFLKVDNLTSLLGWQGYYAADQYPAADFSFQFGITWRFFE